MDNNTDVTDVNGHGTGIAGVIGMIYNNNKGGVGVSSKSDLWIFKTGDNGMGVAASINAIIYSGDNNIDAVNMSYGGGYIQTEKDAVDYAWSKGVFLVGACGNYNEDRILYPAGYEHVMSIGATAKGPPINRSNHSNYGEWVQVFAPGCMITTTYLPEINKYVKGSGTSVAVPFVVALASLLKEQNPDYTNQQVWDRIINTSDTMDFDIGKVLTINAEEALGLTGINEKQIISADDFISFNIAERSLTYKNTQGVLDVYSAYGVKVLSESVQGSGHFQLDLPSGVYYSRFNSNGKIEKDKCIVVR